MNREYCKQDVFRCNTTAEILVWSNGLFGDLSANFVNATDDVERKFDGLTYLGRNPNIVLIEDTQNEVGEYYVYGREDIFKADRKYKFREKDEKDNSNSFKLFAENQTHNFWAKVISKIPFSSLLTIGVYNGKLYNPFNAESPRKEMLVDESGSLSDDSNKTISTLQKLPKALI